MFKGSSLSEEQHEAAVALFEAGWRAQAVATHLRVGAKAIGRLHDQWRVRGGTTLVTKPTKRVFSFEFKITAVQRYLLDPCRANTHLPAAGAKHHKLEQSRNRVHC